MLILVAYLFGFYCIVDCCFEVLFVNSAVVSVLVYSCLCLAFCFA